jgi:L-ascorbate metabolism protein UlaG (beta-lactamase superfamily)
MTTIRRLTDSCLVVTTDTAATLFDPGFHTFESGEVDLNAIGEISRVLVTHEHGDHVNPEFVKWLIDRRSDLTVYSNDAVAGLLDGYGIGVDTGDPTGVSFEDVLHEMIPTGAQPPNRAYTIDGVLTHPGDSYQPTASAPVLALPLIVPWGSTTQSMDFARRLAPRQVIPIHDFYLNEGGRGFAYNMAKNVLAKSDIEVITLNWGETATI